MPGVRCDLEAAGRFAAGNSWVRFWQRGGGQGRLATRTRLRLGGRRKPQECAEPTRCGLFAVTLEALGVLRLATVG